MCTWIYGFSYRGIDSLRSGSDVFYRRLGYRCSHGRKFTGVERVVSVSGDFCAAASESRGRLEVGFRFWRQVSFPGGELNVPLTMRRDITARGAAVVAQCACVRRSGGRRGDGAGVHYARFCRTMRRSIITIDKDDNNGITGYS